MVYWIASFILWVSSCMQATDYTLPIAGVSGEEMAEDRRLSKEELGLREIWNSLALESGQTIVAGKSEQDRVVLTATNAASDTAITLTQLGEFDSQYCISRTVLLSQESPDQGTLVMFAYLINSGGLKFDDSETFLELFILKGDAVTWKNDPLTIARTNVANYIQTDPESVWRYLAIDDSPTGQEPRPGVKSDARILLRDVNADGVLDVVIWEKVFEARRIEDDGPDFPLKQDRLTVMMFDPASEQFAAPETQEGLPKPDEELWDRLPSIGWTMFH